MRLAIVQPQTVKMPGVEVAGQTHDFTFTIVPPRRSLINKLLDPEKYGAMDEDGYATLYSESVKSWDSTALRDLDTGQTIPCDVETMVDLIDQVPEMAMVLARAIFAGYSQHVRGNSKALSDTTGEADNASAEAAETISE